MITPTNNQLFKWIVQIYRGIDKYSIWKAKIQKMRPQAFKLVPKIFFENLGILPKIDKKSDQDKMIMIWAGQVIFGQFLWEQLFPQSMLKLLYWFFQQVKPWYSAFGKRLQLNEECLW